MTPSSYRNASLNLDLFTDNKVNLSDDKGSIEFTFNGNEITDIKVEFKAGTDISYAGQTFDCTFKKKAN